MRTTTFSDTLPIIHIKGGFLKKIVIVNVAINVSLYHAKTWLAGAWILQTTLNITRYKLTRHER